MEDNKKTEKFKFYSSALSDYFETENLEARPDFTETYNQRLNIINWGDRNNFPMFLEELYDNSPIHANLIKRKAFYLGGGGWNYTGLEIDAITFLKNSLGEDMDAILSKVMLDSEKIGAFALNVIWSTEQANTIELIKYIPIQNVRYGSTKDGKFIGWAYHSDWASLEWSMNKNFFNRVEPKLYPNYNKIASKKEKSQILVVRTLNDALTYYPRPYYRAAITDIDTASMIAKFSKAGIENGQNPGLMMTLIGPVPDGKIQEEIAKAFAMKYNGYRKNREMMLTFAESKDTAPVVEAAPIIDSSTFYQDLLQNIEKTIYEAHGIVDKTLFSVGIAGQLGMTHQLKEGMAYFQQGYLNPIQKVVEEAFTKLANDTGINVTLKINKFTPPPIEIVTEAQILSIIGANPTEMQQAAILKYIGMNSEAINEIVYATDKKPIEENKNNIE